MSENWSSLLDSCEEIEEEEIEATEEEILATAVGAIELEEEEEEEEELEYGYSYGQEGYGYGYGQEGEEATWEAVCEEFSLDSRGEPPAYLAETLVGSAPALFSAIRSEQREPPGPSGAAALAALQAIAAAEDHRQERLVDILCVVGGGCPGGEGELEYVSAETGHPFELSALQVAAAEGSIEWLRFILETYQRTAEASDLINYQAPSNFYSALHLACKREGDRSDAVQLLLDAGAFVEAVDLEYRTPLHLAAMAGNADVVETLLSSETSLSVIMAKDSMGLTPLHHAAFGQFEALTIITEWIETVCTASSEPLVYAEVLQAMTDEKGRTALHAAACCCSIEILAVLLEGGMDVNGLDDEGRNVLFWAVSGGFDHAGRVALNKEELELCLTYCITQGAKLDVRDRLGRSPLHAAAYYKHRHACEFFLSQHHVKASAPSTDLKASTPTSDPQVEGNDTVSEKDSGSSSESESDNNKESESEAKAENESEKDSEKESEEGGKETTESEEQPKSESECESESESVGTETEATAVASAAAEGEGPRCLHVMDCDHNGRNAFHYAVALGSDSLRVLLQAVATDNGLAIGLDALTVADKRGMTPLHVAAMQGHEDAVLVLMKKLGQDADLLQECLLAVDERKRGVAFYCAHFGMEEAVAKIFRSVCEEQWAALFTVDTVGKTLFHAAAASGVGRILVCLQEHSSEELFATQAQLHDQKGRAPVHFACACGHEIAVRWFVAQVGADAVLEADGGGDLPAYFAAYFGQCQCIRELLNSTDAKRTFAHTNLRDQTIFHAAAAGGSGEMLNLLLEVSQSLGVMDKLNNSVDADGCTPLLIAAMGGYTYVADTLRHYGAQIGGKDGEGRTIFHFAISTGNAQLLFALLTEVAFDAALVNAQDSKGLTPLHYSAFAGDADCMSMLLSCTEVDPSICDSRGRHALTVSAALGDDHLCSLLLGHAKVSILSQDAQGRTALDAAALQGHVESLQELLVQLLAKTSPQEAAQGLADKRGRTPLHAAALGGHMEACMLLVDKLGLTIDCTDLRGRTPLHYAAAAGRVQCLMALLEMGADASTADVKGARPVQLALRNGHDEACAVLNAMA